MYLFLGLLFVITSVFAQPVEGPWEIATFAPDAQVWSIGTCTRGEYADVFYFVDSTLYAAEFSLATDEVTVEPYALRTFRNSADLKVGDAVAMDENRWACIIDDGGYILGDINPEWFSYTYLFYGTHADFQEALLDSGVGHTPPVAGDNRNGNFSLTHRIGGGLLASWFEFVFVVLDEFAWSRVYLISDAAQVDFIPDFWGGTSFPPELSRPIFRSIAHDSVAGTWAEGSNACLWETGLDQSYCSWFCDVSALLNFGRTYSGDLLTLFTDSALPAGLHAARYGLDEFDRLLCEDELELYILDANVRATDWHPDYGFAALSRFRQDLMLTRIDTTLQQAQPLGVFYEWYGDSYVWAADVSIADNGQVVVLWLESEGAGKHLKLATVEWDTYLESEISAPVAVPASLSLSAYPNPFNGEVRLEYEVPKAGRAVLRVYDIEGREVTQLVDEAVAAGTHAVNWTPNAASGVYFARVQAGNSVATTKLLYLR